MPQSTLSPIRMTDAHSATSVGSASSLLVSSESESAKEKLDSTSSLKNGYVGSFTTLAQPCLPYPPYPETQQKNRAVSMAETSPVLWHDQVQKTTEKVESTLITPNEKELSTKEDTVKKDRRLSTASSDSGNGGCGGLKKKKYRRFGEVDKTEKKKLTPRQWLLLVVLSLATLTSSFAICLFPPFFPKIAEDKGATVSIYGFIIGTNCLTSFLVTPFIGKNLKVIGVRFAFVSGVFIGGICCLLSGFLEYFPPGGSFVVISILIRVIHAAGNAGTITSTFTYTAVEFPNSVAKIFSLTRTMMNIAQLAGPIVGGALYEVGGFKTPFILMGGIQTIMAFIALPFLPDYDVSQYDEGSTKTQSPLDILCIPSIWIPFFTFILSTMSNGFLSINLEPQVLRTFDLTPFYVGIFFGLKDGANSIASPIWGYLCDRRGSVKLCLLSSTMIGALSIFLLGPFPFVPIDRNLAVVGIALALSGVAFAGQQVSGVVDAMREAVHAGYPDNPSTHGLVAGIWSSLSGAGRFVSRAGTGILVDHIGFQMTAVVVFSVQITVGLATMCFMLPKCKKGDGKSDGYDTTVDAISTRTTSFTYSVVDVGEFPRLTISQPESPAESVTCKSVSIPLPRDCAIIRRMRAETYAGFSG
ncbi:MFS-type transporter SLC18B1-like [Daphnia carinata]|uniref:MFS-type transporter SLC18B1-like n=1 Tax=Daphnia carinata TaxID=120202 RepID=UPI00257C1932|nr:MFS-type transporter SLC18B1-like [Daphnia carinata]